MLKRALEVDLSYDYLIGVCTANVFLANSLLWLDRAKEALPFAQRAYKVACLQRLERGNMALWELV
jgi:hypothetical protein